MPADVKGASVPIHAAPALLFFFITLGLEMSDKKVYEP